MLVEPFGVVIGQQPQEVTNQLAIRCDEPTRDEVVHAPVLFSDFRSTRRRSFRASL